MNTLARAQSPTKQLKQVKCVERKQQIKQSSRSSNRRKRSFDYFKFAYAHISASVRKPLKWNRRICSIVRKE